MQIGWWTLALQAINVLILAWLLTRFFYRPVARMIAKRQEAANKLIADADAARKSAEAAQTEIATTRAGFAAERKSLLAQARTAAEAERYTLLEEAKRQADEARAQNQVDLARSRASLEVEMTAKAAELAIDIARRLVGRLSAPAIAAGFLDSLWNQLRTLPDAQRTLVAASLAKGESLEVVSAEPLSEEQKGGCRKMLKDVFGLETAPIFRADPALIAGVELRSTNFVLRDSWRNDLDRLFSDLKADARSSENA